MSETAEDDPDEPPLLATLLHDASVNCGKWSPDGRLLATATDGGGVALWRMGAPHESVTPFGEEPTPETWVCATRLAGHAEDVLGIAWSPDSRRFATCGVDNLVIIWRAGATMSDGKIDFKQAGIVNVLRGHNAWVTGIAWDPIGKLIASQGDDGVVIVWSADDGSIVSKMHDSGLALTETTSENESRASSMRAMRSAARELAFARPSWSCDASQLVVAGGFNGVEISPVFSRVDWEVVCKFVGHSQATTVASFSPRMFQSARSTPDNPKYFTLCAVGSRDRTISIWSTTQGRPLIVLKGFFGATVLDLVWGHDGRSLIAVSHSGEVAMLRLSLADLDAIDVSAETYVSQVERLYGSSSALVIASNGRLIPRVQKTGVLARLGSKRNRDILPETATIMSGIKGHEGPAKHARSMESETKTVGASDSLERAKKRIAPVNMNASSTRSLNTSISSSTANQFATEPTLQANRLTSGSASSENIMGREMKSLESRMTGQTRANGIPSYPVVASSQAFPLRDTFNDVSSSSYTDIVGSVLNNIGEPLRNQLQTLLPTLIYPIVKDVITSVADPLFASSARMHRHNWTLLPKASTRQHIAYSVTARKQSLLDDVDEVKVSLSDLQRHKSYICECETLASKVEGMPQTRVTLRLKESSDNDIVRSSDVSVSHFPVLWSDVVVGSVVSAVANHSFIAVVSEEVSTSPQRSQNVSHYLHLWDGLGRRACAPIALEAPLHCMDCLPSAKNNDSSILLIVTVNAEVRIIDALHQVLKVKSCISHLLAAADGIVSPVVSITSSEESSSFSAQVSTNPSVLTTRMPKALNDTSGLTTHLGCARMTAGGLALVTLPTGSYVYQDTLDSWVRVSADGFHWGLRQHHLPHSLQAPKGPLRPIQAPFTSTSLASKVSATSGAHASVASVLESHMHASRVLGDFDEFQRLGKVYIQELVRAGDAMTAGASNWASSKIQAFLDELCGPLYRHEIGGAETRQQSVSDSWDFANMTFDVVEFAKSIIPLTFLSSNPNVVQLGLRAHTRLMGSNTRVGTTLSSSLC